MAVKPLLSNVERNIPSAEPDTPLNKFAGIVVKLVASWKVLRKRGCPAGVLDMVGNTDPNDPDIDAIHLEL